MSSEYFMTPHIDDAGNIGAVQHIFPPILDAMIAIAGPGASGHSDAIGLGGVTDGIDSLLLPYINTATIGGQMAEKEFGWPQCTPGVKPNCPWSPHPSGRPTAACQATIYDQSCRFAQGQGGKFMEIFGGTSTCYPAETLQMAVDFGWPTS
jgi:hypothetical protein